MIKSKHSLATSVNQPKIISLEHIRKSGRGIHILLKGDLPFKGKNNCNGVEIYKSSRYFIVTGEKLIYETMIENQEAVDYVVDKYFPETVKENDSSGNSQRI